MSYIEDITEPLIQTMNHTGGLPVHQLAGHAANLGFWVGEVRHAFDVIDGYSQRFANMGRSEREYVERQRQRDPKKTHSHGTGPPLKRGIRDHELKDLRRRLADVMYHLLGRCYKEELITEAALDEFADTLVLDVLAIKRGV